jgi:hypothetical protein
MTIPSFYNTDFRRIEVAGSVDVQDVIDDIIDELTVQLPVASRWTSLGGGEYRSPYQDPTGANRFMSVTLVRDSAVLLSFQVKDKNGTTVIDRSIQFTTSFTYRIWSGPYHLCVEFEYGTATYEQAYAVMLDPTPFGLQSVWPYVCAWATRSSAGVADVTAYACSCWTTDGSTPSYRIMMSILTGIDPALRTTGGNDIVLPAEVSVYSSSILYGAGKMYQFAVVSSLIAYKTAMTVPLDSGTTGQFEVLGMASQATNNSGRLAIRKA